VTRIIGKCHALAECDTPSDKFIVGTFCLCRINIDYVNTILPALYIPELRYMSPFSLLYISLYSFDNQSMYSVKQLGVLSSSFCFKTFNEIRVGMTNLPQ